MDDLEASAVCRLCLQITSGDDIQALEGFTVYMLKLVAPTLNLEISPEPKICKKCAEKVKASHDFKTACLENNEISQPTFLNTTAQKKDDTCKCCLCDTKTNLKKCKPKEIILLNAMLDRCLPELDIKRTSDICPKCLKSLVNLFAFFNCCIDTEDKIKKHLKIKGANRKGQVSLLDIYHVHYIVKLEEEEEERNPYNRSTTNHEEEISEEDLEDYEEVGVKVKKTFKMEKNSNWNAACGNTNSVQETSQNQVATDYEEEGDCEDYEEVDVKMEISETALVTGGHSNGLDQAEQTLQASYRKYKGFLKEAETRRGSSYPMYVKTGTSSEPQSPIYKCDNCQYKTVYETNFSTHTCPSRSVLHCPDCGYETVKRKNFCEHLLGHEIAKPKKLHCCTVCSYQSKNKYHLLDHEMIHKDSSMLTMFCCRLCKYSTKRKYDLCPHLMRVHKMTRIEAKKEMQEIVDATKVEV